MSMPPHSAKRDASEQAIVEILERVGFSVYRLDKSVDLLCGFRGRNYLIEVKTGSKGYGKGLNANQQSFATDWRGSPVFTLHSVDDAVAFSRSIARGERLG
ncbi:MAG: hypothetical protein ACT6U0_27130 [Shinella sp.]|uniref:hypothetical protein n=1 Tax=Shinella sp. TaxID=1870904 RepID=UPI004036A2F7